MKRVITIETRDIGTILLLRAQALTAVGHPGLTPDDSSPVAIGDGACARGPHAVALGPNAHATAHTLSIRVEVGR